jgi:hypothetical protein
MWHGYKNTQPFMELGNPPVPLEQLTSVQNFLREAAEEPGGEPERFLASCHRNSQVFKEAAARSCHEWCIPAGLPTETGGTDEGSMFKVLETSDPELRATNFTSRPFCMSRFTRMGVRREQHHDPRMGQAPAVREAESVQ